MRSPQYPFAASVQDDLQTAIGAAGHFASEELHQQLAGIIADLATQQKQATTVA